MVKIVKVDVHVLQAPCEKYVCQASCSFWGGVCTPCSVWTKSTQSAIIILSMISLPTLTLQQVCIFAAVGGHPGRTRCRNHDRYWHYRVGRWLRPTMDSWNNYQKVWLFSLFLFPKNSIRTLPTSFQRTSISPWFHWNHGASYPPIPNLKHRHFESILIGANPLEGDKLWEIMYNALRDHGEWKHQPQWLFSSTEDPDRMPSTANKCLAEVGSELPLPFMLTCAANILIMPCCSCLFFIIRPKRGCDSSNILSGLRPLGYSWQALWSPRARLDGRSYQERD